MNARHLMPMLGLLACSSNGAVAAEAVPTYTATYQVEYKGKDLGTSEFSVRHSADSDVYEFSSRTVAKGLLKLMSPNPVIERSKFRVTDAGIVPLEFTYEDGSRKGEDNVHIAFDWERRIATVTDSSGRREIALRAGALDRGSLQVALMRDLATTGRPAHYLVADEEAVKDYVYMEHGETTTATGIGSLATRELMQQREGSSRSTWLWVAPDLGFLPVRIEQRRDGEVQTAFTLASVTGLSD